MVRKSGYGLKRNSAWCDVAVLPRSPLQNSFIFMVITGVNVVLSVVVIKLSGKGVEDRVFLLVAGILFTAGPVVMYQVWFYDMSVLQFYIGVVAACLGCPFGFAPNRS